MKITSLFCVSPKPGFEPGICGLSDQRSNHSATTSRSGRCANRHPFVHDVSYVRRKRCGGFLALLSSLSKSRGTHGLKSGKDQLLFEMIKAGSTLPVLTKLYNQLLSRGSFPPQWRYNSLSPLYKNKVDRFPRKLRRHCSLQ